VLVAMTAMAMSALVVRMLMVAVKAAETVMDGGVEDRCRLMIAAAE